MFGLYVKSFMRFIPNSKLRLEFEALFALVAITVEDVHDTLNTSDSDIPEAKVHKMIKRAAVTVGLEISSAIDSENCTDAQKEAITVLAAVYAVCFLTGGSAVGLNFTAGDINASVASKLPSLDVLQGELSRLIDKLKKPYIGVA